MIDVRRPFDRGLHVYRFPKGDLTMFQNPLKFVSFALVFAFAASSVALANTYHVTFTDSQGDAADLFLTTIAPISETGTNVTSISGTFGGANVSEANVFGADQAIYSTGPFVNINGLGFSTPTPFNLYWDPGYYSFFTTPLRDPGGFLAICYTSTCWSQRLFYRVTDFSLTEVIPASEVPAPNVGAGLPGLVIAVGGLLAWRKKRKGAALAA
jgi:hypothetical protein